MLESKSKNTILSAVKTILKNNLEQLLSDGVGKEGVYDNIGNNISDNITQILFNADLKERLEILYDYEKSIWILQKNIKMKLNLLQTFRKI
jgi:hypothetical protein